MHHKNTSKQSTIQKKMLFSLPTWTYLPICRVNQQMVIVCEFMNNVCTPPFEVFYNLVFPRFLCLFLPV